MPIPKPEVQQPMVEIERQLSLPSQFLVSLYENEDDWSFVIKTHAFLEAALTHLLTEHLGNAELLPIFAYLETSNIRTGKLAFVKAFDLLNKGGRRFIHTLSELRNDLVHEVANVRFTFTDYLAPMSEKERQEFIGAFDYALVAMALEQNQPIDAETRATIDTIVTTAPRLAIVGGAALIAVDIYFKNRDAAVPRQAFAQLRGRIFEEWRRIQNIG